MKRPFDYSKWDNVDADSEPEGSPPSVPAAAPATRAPEPTTTPQSPGAPPAPATAAPTTNGEPDGSTPTCQAVIVRCERDKLRALPWSAITIKADHPIFSTPVAPVPELLGIPLVFYCVGEWSERRADLDNQIITYLNINATTGFAPAHWQSHIGTAVVARRDWKPLLPQHLEALWMYCDYILDLFGEGRGAPTHLYNRRAFEAWWEEYRDQQKEFRRGTRGEKDPEDWRAVRSPYEV